MVEKTTIIIITIGEFKALCKGYHHNVPIFPRIVVKYLEYNTKPNLFYTIKQ
mgnify:CR=1 FL=1